MADQSHTSIGSNSVSATNITSGTVLPSKQILLAPKSCGFCRAQKRKCDKLLPQCSRCNKQGNFCHYMELVNNKNNLKRYQFVQMGHNGPAVISPLQSLLSLDSSTGTTFSQFWLQPGVVDQQITNEVLGLFNNVSVNFDDVIETMRVAVYPLLPIVDIADFREQVYRLPHESSAEVATLLLAVHLMNHLSTPIKFVYQNAGNDVLLVTCRRFFTILQLDRKERLETIQAGILLSALELNSGLFSEASLTVTTCAALGYKLGLHQAHTIGAGQYSESDTTRRNMWCSIVLLDRLIYVADPFSNCVMAIPDDDLEKGFNPDASSSTSPPEKSPGAANLLILQTRAAQVLGKVWSFAGRQSVCAKDYLESSFWELDNKLRPLSMIAIQQSTVKKDIPCIASPIIFIAMTALYQYRLESDAWTIPDRTPTYMPAFLALESVLSMVRDIMRINDKQNAPITVPEIILYYVVARAVTNLSRIYPAYVSVVKDITELLKIQSQRSTLAEIYVKRLQRRIHS